MAASARAVRLLKAMDKLATKTFDNMVVIKKLQLQSPSNGTMQGSFTVDTSMCNIGGSLHGGYIASITDVLSFYTLLSNPDGRVSWTTNMNIKYIRSAYEGEKISVVSNSVKSGSSPIVETSFHNEKGKLLAKATTLFQEGPDEFQKLAKKILDFDVYQN